MLNETATPIPAAAPSPHDLQPIPVSEPPTGRPEHVGPARLIVKLDWLNEATIRRALADGHLRRDIPASDIDAALPAVQAWLGKLDAAALTEGRRIIYSAYYFAVYGVLDVSIVTPDESALWSDHPHWSYHRVQRVTRRRLRRGT